MPLVLVIVLNWNGWRDTLKCLSSLKALDYPNCRVIVVDNGSTDDSVIYVRRVYPEIELLETGENLGFAGGCNVGINHALKHGAEYVWLLNNDTSVAPNSLTEMLMIAEANPRVGAVGAVIYHLNEPGEVQEWAGGRVRMWLGVLRPFTNETLRTGIHYISGCSMLLRREALNDVGLLDPTFFMYWEDVDYCFRLRQFGWELEVAKAGQVWHKKSASAGYSTRRYKYYNASAKRFFKLHSRFWIVPMVIGNVGRIIKYIIIRNWICGARILLRSIKILPLSG